LGSGNKRRSRFAADRPRGRHDRKVRRTAGNNVAE